MARRLYEEWFVHFRFPGHEDATFIEAEDGRVPEGWEYKRLQDFIELAYGKALKAADREEGPYPVYGSSGIVGTHKDYLVEGPGIILGRKGNVGSVHWTEHSFFPIDTVYYVKTELPLEYVFFNLQKQNFLNNDAAVPGLNRNQAYALPFLKPSDELLEKFTLHCKPLYDLVRKLRRKNENLSTQRDLLLPKLISEEIDVSEAEEVVGEEAA
jgi:type I restriction enzyme S subunit